ncbi:uncharacterized protein LOC142326874 [Lycorma delicatula]|uniref:uncharacterized protein LOC142326874 n=1 Tax=Lycorma delicatula TaxID=130591 RepID=UPI003F514244
MQLITQLKIPPGMFESLSVLPGSIMVTMQLINTNPVTVNDVLPKLVRALNNGELSLVGINGEKLNVPQQLLQITEKQTGGENNSYIGLIILCSILLLLSIIFVSIFVTSLIVKRSHEKVMSEIQQNLEEPKLPKYRQLYFEESIDGSAKSLSQYQQPRRNGTVNSLSSPQCKEEHDSGIGINGKLEKIQKI